MRRIEGINRSIMVRRIHQNLVPSPSCGLGIKRLLCRIRTILSDSRKFIRKHAHLPCPVRAILINGIRCPCLMSAAEGAFLAVCLFSFCILDKLIGAIYSVLRIK